jgi:hypothetical protein
MVSNVNNGQNGAATSAMENIFSKKSVLDFAVYAYNKMAKNPNGGTGNFSVVVGDNWRITMDSCMEENECRLCLNIYIEEKNGSRYCRIQKINTGYMDMATEYMSNGSWKSVVVYEIKSKIEKMVGMLLDSYIKDNSDWSIKEWEKLTGMVYNAPIAEVDEVEDDEDELDAEDFLRENMPIIPVDIIKETITEVLDDEETFYRLFGGINRCDFNDFADIVWEKTWEKVLDAHMSDEALESETREWMEFNDRVRFILESDASDKYEFVVNYHNELCCSEREENNDTPNLNEDVIIDYLMNLDSRPDWVYKDVFDFEVKGDYLDIVMFGDYHIGLYFDPDDIVNDFAKVNGSSAYGKEDMKYALEIMENRDEILALAGFEYKYNVIAHCSDGDVIIGKDGVNDVTIDVAKEIALAHMNMGVEISIEKVVKL